jgi:hypothetical protein
VPVVAPEIGATVADLAARGLFIMRRRPAARDVFRNAALVVPATCVAERDQLLGRPLVIMVCRLPLSCGDEATDRSWNGDLVGGGPGDPRLPTVAGLEAIKEADLIVCDRLAPLAALQHARPEAAIIDVAKIPRGASTSQEQINQILVEQASAGKTVVRLKGGDAFVFSRDGEEWQACAVAGIPVTVIPDVSSALLVQHLRACR